MKILLIGLTLLVISNSATTTLSLSQVYQCSCGNAQQQEDCLIDYCIWDSDALTCSNKSCDVFNQNDCQGVPQPFKCVWNYKSSKCETFTKCSDYSFSIAENKMCYDLNKCQVDIDSINNTAQTVNCMDRVSVAAYSISSCDKVPFSECNWLVTPDGKQCVKNISTQTCEAKTITQCSDYANSELCNTYACYWDTSCKPLTCSNLTMESCLLYYSIDTKLITICTWNGSKCLDVDTKTLTQQQCLSYTLHSYIWNPDTEQCEVCQDDNSSTNFLLYASFILAIVLN